MKSDENRGDYLRLDMNENPNGLPQQFVKKVLEGITPQLLAMYPETDKLVLSIANHIQVSNTSIALTNGSDEALKTTFEIFGEPCKKVIMVTPSFAMYPIYAQMVGMKCIFVPYQDDFTVSTANILEKIDSETGIVSLVNPNNPMGNVYTVDQIEQILKKAADFGAWVIVDEAYHYFYPYTVVNLVNKYENLIVTRTFSKLCSIAGLRIGYAISNAKNITLFNAIRPTYCINTVAVQFAKAILEDNELIPFLLAEECEGRTWLLKQLQSAKYCVVCKQGNFLFIQTKTNPFLLEQKLKKHLVLVKTYNIPLLSRFIRITTGDIKTMKKFWEIFSELEVIDNDPSNINGSWCWK